jgi:hypothetical protein
MRKPRKEQARKRVVALLLEHPDGLLTRDIATALDMEDYSVCHVVKASDRIYLDRWVPHRDQPRRLVPVYCAVALNLPEDCPKPD